MNIKLVISIVVDHIFGRDAIFRFFFFFFLWYRLIYSWDGAFIPNRTREIIGLAEGTRIHTDQS